MDLNEYSKNTRTTDMNPDRFKCILSEFALKQKMVKRQYLHALPYYIEEREARMAELKKQDELKQSLARTIEQEGDHITGQSTAAALAKIAGKAPPANLERALDPQAIARADKTRQEF